MKSPHLPRVVSFWSRVSAAGFAAALVLRFLLPSVAAAERVDVRIEEWAVTEGAFPHDPESTPDGFGWFTGMHKNLLGRVDPATGATKGFPLPTPNSAPHGLVADRNGHIWYTANAAGLIGRLDPKTGAVTEYKMPDPTARDPHTAIFDQKGVLWFTVQQGNFVGRLDPHTGAIALKPVPTRRALPYGIVINSKGVPFFDLFGTNKLGSIDPATLEITEYPLPEGARPRRIAVTGDDVVWYTDYARGFLGRLDPVTKQVREFASPGGSQSRPYGITPTADGALWYSESGVMPNTLVRFDPKSGAMQSWPIPSGGGVVRHMVTARDGSLWLACSGVGKVARVKIASAR